MGQVSSFLNLHLATFKILRLLEELLWVANTSKDMDPCRLCAVTAGSCGMPLGTGHLSIQMHYLSEQWEQWVQESQVLAE